MDVKACDRPSEPSPKDKIIQQIDEFLSEHLGDKPTEFRREKIIHDGLWGTLQLSPEEVTFLDTSLFQRLRQLHQTGLAFFTYPSTTHSRFEHVLGVIYQTDKLAKALQSRKLGISERDVRMLRLAAMFHDLGHGPFSHTSEILYGWMPVMTALRKENKYHAAKPHEILSELIVNAPRFRSFCSCIEALGGQKIPLDDIGHYIVGSDRDASDTFKREVLNGPFDADKLDYFFRDSHFSGIQLAVDLDRLFYTVRIADVSGTPRLVVTQSGATPLEQIFFSRMVLHTTVYQHHKVRACDCMFAGVVEYMREHTIPMQVRGKSLDWSSPVDFLWASESEFLSLGFRCPDGALHQLIHDLYYRRLLKRAMVISRHTLQLGPEDDRWDELQRHAKDSSSMTTRREIAADIWKAAGQPCLKEQVWLDLPELPNMKAADETFVLPAEMEGAKPIPLNQLFPTGQWVKNYGLHKWRGHVFCPPEFCDVVAKAAKPILENRYNVKILPEAFTWCKLNPPN